MARAIWKARLLLGDVGVPVKLYSAVEDRSIHFRLLHARDLSPVKQRLVRKTDGEEVPREDLRKAFPIDTESLVVLQPVELDEVQPAPSRDIRLCRFVPPALVDDRWYDRPYFLGPDGDDASYFALARAIARKEVEGVAQWVMRKKQYVGALRAADGYLLLVTLRRADQIVSLAGVEPPARSRPDPKELRLAEQLVAALEADFDPREWHDEYRERVARLIEAKARGESITVEEPRRRRAAGGLAESLRESIRAAKGKRVA